MRQLAIGDGKACEGLALTSTGISTKEKQQILLTHQSRGARLLTHFAPVVNTKESAWHRASYSMCCYVNPTSVVSYRAKSTLHVFDMQK